MHNPFLINIDVCGICNESCNYCPRSSSYPNIKEYMSVELFTKFINDCKDYSGTICFSGRGENSFKPVALRLRLPASWREANKAKTVPNL